MFSTLQHKAVLTVELSDFFHDDEAEVWGMCLVMLSCFRKAETDTHIGLSLFLLYINI